ncbi:MAG: hypothetical protein VW447_08090, partial [Limnobacter sp.]
SRLGEAAKSEDLAQFIL